MTIKEMGQKYLNHIKLNFTSGTYKHNLSHLSHFNNWCDMNQVIDVRDLNEACIVDYISHMKKTCESITINKRVGIIKRALKTAGVHDNFIFEINKFKEKKKTFKMIGFEDLKRLRKAALNLSDKKNSLVVKCVLLLLMDTGCRVNELIHIEKRNVDFQNQRILLTTTKTSSDRYVYFFESTAKEIHKLYQVKPNNKYLLHNLEKDRQLNYFDITYIMKKYKKLLKLDSLHAHMFRHSLASLLLMNKADIKSVQILMGHSDLKTTERYLHTNNSHVQTTYFNSLQLDT